MNKRLTFLTNNILFYWFDNTTVICIIIKRSSPSAHVKASEVKVKCANKYVSLCCSLIGHSYVHLCLGPLLDSAPHSRAIYILTQRSVWHQWQLCKDNYQSVTEINKQINNHSSCCMEGFVKEMFLMFIPYFLVLFIVNITHWSCCLFPYCNHSFALC